MSFFDLLKAQYKTLPQPLTPEDCHGRTFIVTGANAGLGLEATKHLVSLGSARVIMAVRNTSSGEAAKKDIEEATDRHGVLQVWSLDLASYDSVVEFAANAQTELDRIDGLIERATRRASRSMSFLLCCSPCCFYHTWRRRQPSTPHCPGLP